MHPHISHGWPYDDCTIHVQVRQKNKNMDLVELETECEAFGKVYVGPLLKQINI